MSVPEPSRPDICFFHWRERITVKPAYGFVRLSCPECDYFQIIEACKSCYEHIEHANKHQGTRRCFGCGKKFTAPLCRVPIGRR